MSGFVSNLLLSVCLLFIFVQSHFKLSLHKTPFAKPDSGVLVELPLGRTRYTEFGRQNASETFILVHGMTEYSFVWIPLAEKLAKEGYRVISYDLYGRGYSDAPPMAYDERVFVSQLSHLLIRLNLGETPINLVGLSLGGGVSVAFTSLFPHNVKRLILLASVGFPFELPLISKVMKLPILAELVCYYFGVQLLKPRATAAFPYPERFLPQIQQLQNAYQFQSEINPNYNLAIGATIRDFPFGELIHHFQEVGKTKRPTLLLWGEKDKTVPIAQAHEIQNTIPGSTLVSLPDCGHAILQSHIEEVFSEIFKFMQNNK